MAQIKDLKRMCKSYEDCTECGLYDGYESCGVCFLPDSLDQIVDEWVKEHPMKTYASDFFEKFPNAQKRYDGVPNICVKCLYGELDIDCVKPNCSDCWNQEMKGE